jgi:acyl-CoA dehydrogenase
MMMQTIADSGAGMAGAQSIHPNIYTTQPLIRFSSKEQLETTIPKIVSSEYQMYFGIKKPNASLNTLHLETVVKHNPDGSYSVTGQKI